MNATQMKIIGSWRTRSRRRAASAIITHTTTTGVSTRFLYLFTGHLSASSSARRLPMALECCTFTLRYWLLRRHHGSNTIPYRCITTSNTTNRFTSTHLRICAKYAKGLNIYLRGAFRTLQPFPTRFPGGIYMNLPLPEDPPFPSESMGSINLRRVHTESMNIPQLCRVPGFELDSEVASAQVD